MTATFSTSRSKEVQSRGKRTDISSLCAVAKMAPPEIGEQRPKAADHYRAVEALVEGMCVVLLFARQAL